MKKALLILTIAATLFGCTKKENLTPSVPTIPSGYKTELIIDTSIVTSTRNNFAIIQTGNSADTMYASYYSGATFKVDTNYMNIALVYMINPNWVSIGGSKMVAYFPNASYTLIFFSNNNGTGGDTPLPSQYLLITNGDTVNNFGH